jgi:hypothetical protein
MKRYFPTILLFACGAALILGILQLFELRYEVGDVYPKYSSLRSDPLGTMAFYESVARLPGMTSQRDLSTSNRLPDGKGTAYFHVATTIDGWQQLPEETLREIERFAAAGGRLVITMFPESSMPSVPAPQPGVPVKKIDRWGVDFQIISLKHDAAMLYEPAHVKNESGLPLPETLDWHSGIVFADLNPAWKTIYTREANAVVIERNFGTGSIVIATDSYFLSNEAMLRDRHADLLAWLVGASRNVVFDEAHLGVTEQPNVATLLRKYRLYWFAAGLLLLAGLFIWKNALSLVPPHSAEQVQDYVTGKDAAAGFDSLLRRSISPRDLFAVCFIEWKKSAGQTRKYSAARIQQAEASFDAENALPAKDRDPVRAYQNISRILQTKIK